MQGGRGSGGVEGGLPRSVGRAEEVASILEARLISEGSVKGWARGSRAGSTRTRELYLGRYATTKAKSGGAAGAIQKREPGTNVGRGSQEADRIARMTRLLGAWIQRARTSNTSWHQTSFPHSLQAVAPKMK